MAGFYVLDVPEFAPLVEAVRADPRCRLHNAVAGYRLVEFADAITIDDGFDTTLNLSNAEWIWSGSSVNLLLALDNGPVYSGPGFNGPLGAGDYSFLMRENFSMTDINGDPGGNMLVGYTIQFVIAPVPEPGSATLLLAGTFFLTRRRRR